MYSLLTLSRHHKLNVTWSLSQLYIGSKVSPLCDIIMPLEQWYDRCVVALPEITEEAEERLFPQVVPLDNNEAMLTYQTAGEDQVWRLLALNDDHTVTQKPLIVPKVLGLAERPTIARVGNYVIACGVSTGDFQASGLPEELFFGRYSIEAQAWDETIPAPSINLQPMKRPSLCAIGDTGPSRFLLAGGVYSGRVAWSYVHRHRWFPSVNERVLDV
ncbi:hypothetical protein KIPB_002154 [Kipferlia bialata]|uniref:Uncharacterized protein n=1 Tax=Kipferlia bialata TaxID=797122 RepID=A0A9K3CPR5_9EUKA|nr:hypothetical protein KIPB_002154 [Kipferlia bialata]|eukprot:g2154.t1